ncbi:MAG: glutamyl-tRNA reductase [Actinomycetota bacterium]
MILALSAGRDSPSELRARLAYVEATQREVLRAPRPGVGELALVCTCHRTEAYFTSEDDESEAIHTVAATLPGLLPTDHHDLRLMKGLEAVEHLFRVACGLDSLVIGEPQVLGQIRRAYALAREEAAAGATLSNLFGRAIRLGKQVRNGISSEERVHSIGSIAAEHLALRLGGLAGRSGCVVGAGEAATDAARSLFRCGARLAVVSRNRPSAARLAGEVDATGHLLKDLPEVLSRSEFAVVAVSSGILVRVEDLPRRSPEHPFLVLDLSVPRAVEIDGRTDVELQSLEEIPGRPGPEMEVFVAETEPLVLAELARLERWLGTRASGTAIRDLRARALGLVQAEVARATSGLNLPTEAEKRMTILGMRIAKKLLHGPTTALREADDETRALIRRIFGLG